MKSVLDGICPNPVFTMTIPSTGKKMKYRGFTAGEEQSLLFAKESGDMGVIFTNIKEVIGKCFFDELDPETLASFDIEYILITLRAQSVGDMIDINLPCAQCKKKLDFVIHINDIEAPTVPKGANIIKITEELTIICRWPGFDAIEQLSVDKVDIFPVLADIITQIVHGENVIEASELNPAEVTKFVRGLNSKFVKKLSDFIYSIPTITHTSDVKCIHCGNDNKYEFKGIQHFFN